MPAHATYSITAVDMTTHEVGGAGASCVPYEVIRIYAGVPNRGALNAQASLEEAARDDAAAQLAQGLSATDVLASVTSTARYPNAAKMQWGIVDVNGNLSRATGASTIAFAGDLEGATSDRRFRFTTQGNILTSVHVLERASSAFLGQGCDLTERLVLALEAAGSQGEGDNRCTPDGVPAKSAYVQVTSPAGTLFRVSTPDVSPADPTPLVRRAYDEWRATHPCPESTPSISSRPPESVGCSCSTPRSTGERGVWLSAALAALAALRASRDSRRRAVARR